jgi:large subunit ribosomal protein L7/L12
MAEEIKLSKSAQEVMDAVEKMTVLELAELVKAMEEKFGVSAAAPVAMAGPAAAGEAAAPVEEKDSFNVVLKDGGATKIAVIKAVRELNSNLGLVEAKALVDKGDAVILENAKKEDAENAKKKLEDAGAKVELQ